MKILKVLVYDDKIALEYEAKPGYPETFLYPRTDKDKLDIEGQTRGAVRALKEVKRLEAADALTKLANQELEKP